MWHDGDEVSPGQAVRLTERHRRGRVAEVDRALMVARVELHGGGETWARWDELELLDSWAPWTDHTSGGNTVL